LASGRQQDATGAAEFLTTLWHQFKTAIRGGGVAAKDRPVGQ